MTKLSNPTWTRLQLQDEAGERLLTLYRGEYIRNARAARTIADAIYKFLRTSGPTSP